MTAGIFGQGLAEEAKKRLNARGVAEVIFETIQPGQVDYSGIVGKMQNLGVEVLYYGGFRHEAGLLLRQAHDGGYNLQTGLGGRARRRGFRSHRRSRLGMER